MQSNILGVYISFICRNWKALLRIKYFPWIFKYNGNVTENEWKVCWFKSSVSVQQNDVRVSNILNKRYNNWEGLKKVFGVCHIQDILTEARI